MKRNASTAMLVAGVVLAVLIAVMGFAPSANAIPAFSSRHGVSCNTCHSNEWPRLNRFGYEYKLRGYRMSFDGGEKIKSPSDVVSAVYKYTRVETKPAHKTWSGENHAKDVDLFGILSFGPKKAITFFSEVDLIEGAMLRHSRWLKAANVVMTFGNEKNSFQVRGGRLPQFRGSLFMGADRYALAQPFIMADAIQGHQFGKNYGLGGEFLYTRNMKTTLRAFAMQLDEVSGYRDSNTFGFNAQRLLGGGESSMSFSVVHSAHPRLAGRRSSVTRMYATASWDAHAKLLFSGGLAGGKSRAWNGVTRGDFGFYGEMDIRPWSSVTLITRYDELDVDVRSLAPKRGVSEGLIISLFKRNNFHTRFFGEYGSVFNTGSKNKRVVKIGFTATF